MNNDSKPMNTGKLRKPLLWVAAGIMSVCSQNVHAQLLFSEAFNYTPASTLGGNVNPGNTTAWSGGNAVLSIGGSQLTYSGLQEAAGNDLLYTSGVSSSTSLNTFSAVSGASGDSIYYSFLIDCTTLPTANNYLTSLNASPTTPGGSSDDLAIYAGTPSAGTWKIGVRTDGGGSGGVYSGALSLNTTYFVVAELTYGTTSVTDPSVANLFVDPVPGGSQPGTPTATQSTTTALTAISDVGFKAQSSASAGDFTFDNLLIGDTWGDVTPMATPEPSTFALLGGSLVGAWSLRRRQAAR
jgi:hypothetical protein